MNRHRKTSGVGTRTNHKDEALVQEVLDIIKEKRATLERNERQWGLSDEVRTDD